MSDQVMVPVDPGKPNTLHYSYSTRRNVPWVGMRAGFGSGGINIVGFLREQILWKISLDHHPQIDHFQYSVTLLKHTLPFEYTLIITNTAKTITAFSQK